MFIRSMKSLMYKTTVATVVLWSSLCGMVMAQERSTLARAFCQDIWVNNESAETIARKYLLPHPIDMTDKTKRIQFINELLKELRKDQPVDGTDFHVQPYASVPRIAGLDNSVPTRDVYAVTTQNKPTVYVLFDGSKIVSCTLIKKGNRSYFMPW